MAYPRLKNSILIAASLHLMPTPALGMADERASEFLNLFLRATDGSSSGALSKEECGRLVEFSLMKSGEIARFQMVASQLFMQRCGEEVRSRRQEDGSLQHQDRNPVSGDVWDGIAVCAQGNEQILQCEHRASNGRGIFVYAGRATPENSPTLVCVHFEATYRRPFEREQLVDARCVVTEFDWRYEALRSDVSGIGNWMTKPVNHSPVQIPAALKEQCSQVFPDALYCTPTLIVFPETSGRSVGICHLKTHDSILGLGSLLKIGSWNSRWKCESKNLDIPDRDLRLSVEERSCVPDHLGQQRSPFCRFPYLPVARRPLRTFLE